MTSTAKSSSQERAASLVDAALALQQAGDRDAALEILTRAQTLAPDYASIHMLIGLIYQEQARWEEAEARFHRVLELEPDNPDALQSLGLLLLKQGRADDGLAMLRRHLALKPADPTTLKAIAGELLGRKQRDEAVQLYDQAWQATHREEVGLSYGRLLLRVGRPEQAEQILRDVVDEAPTPLHLLELGRALLVRGRGGEAAEILARASALDPNSVPILGVLSGAYLMSMQLPEALETAERLLALDSEDCRNWLTKANALFMLGRYEEVLEATHRGSSCISAEVAPKTPEYLLLMQGQALEALGRLTAAQEVFAAARTRFPPGEEALQREVRVLNHLNRPAEVLRLLEEAEATDARSTSKSAPARFEALHRLGRHDDAWSLILPLLEDQTEMRLNTLGEVGLTLYREGRPATARAVFEQLVRFAPNLPRFRTNLGFILTGEGELAEAERMYVHALQQNTEPDLRVLILVDLGYLYLIQRDRDRADVSLTEALSLGKPDNSAILRVAYWRDGAVHPDAVAHPTESVPVRAAVLANQVALTLAGNQMAEAEELANQVTTEFPDFAQGFLVAGCERFAAGDKRAARQYWQQAVERSHDAQQREAVAAWLAELMD